MYGMSFRLKHMHALAAVWYKLQPKKDRRCAKIS